MKSECNETHLIAGFFGLPLCIWENKKEWKENKVYVVTNNINKISCPDCLLLIGSLAG